MIIGFVPLTNVIIHVCCTQVLFVVCKAKCRFWALILPPFSGID